MIARFRKDPLVGNVLGLVALFIALGAGAYAAGLAPNSVKSKHIKDGQVKEDDLGVESVTNTALGLNSVASENVVDDDLAGADIDEDGLGSVPNADAAENADLLDNKDSTAFQEVGSEGWTTLDLNDASGGASCNWFSFLAGSPIPRTFATATASSISVGWQGRRRDATNVCSASPGSMSTSLPSAVCRTDTARRTGRSSWSTRTTRRHGSTSSPTARSRHSQASRRMPTWSSSYRSTA